jgi:hypothetical protein
MRSIIATVATVSALGLASSSIPAEAQHRGGMSGAPSAGVGRAAPSMPSMAAPSRGNFSSPTGPGPSANFSGPGRNFAAQSPGNFAPNRGSWAWRGDRDHDRRHRGFRGFAFGAAPFFWGDYGYDYGADYAYDNDNGYDDSCYALRRVYYGGYWHTRRVWICG